VLKNSKAVAETVAGIDFTNTVQIVAGPCAVEDRSSLLEIAHLVAENGVQLMRAGVFKPRTSPYSFQGLGEKALEFLQEAKQRYGLKVVSEALSPEDIPVMQAVVDVLQIGSRNMFNYRLIQTAGASGKPVLLKRGMMATLDELLWSAEYALLAGAKDMLLCERGIRTFETATRNTLDLAAVPVLQEKTWIPVIVDPSHGTGKSHLVIPMALAGIGAGANGIMVEVHPRPEKALSDGFQALDFKAFERLVKEVRSLAAAMGKTTPDPDKSRT